MEALLGRDREIIWNHHPFTATFCLPWRIAITPDFGQKLVGFPHARGPESPLRRNASSKPKDAFPVLSCYGSRFLSLEESACSKVVFHRGGVLWSPFLNESTFSSWQQWTSQRQLMLRSELEWRLHSNMWFSCLQKSERIFGARDLTWGGQFSGLMDAKKPSSSSPWILVVRVGKNPGFPKTRVSGFSKTKPGYPGSGFGFSYVVKCPKFVNEKVQVWTRFRRWKIRQSPDNEFLVW